jgi:hypothetical protein
MTETRIDGLLDELVPAIEPRSDGWDDVLARANTTRRRYAAVAVAALALLLVPTAVALRGRIADLFQGTLAPPAISTSFEANNKLADMAMQKGFGDKFPHDDVSQAHGVIEIQTADGLQDLWVAPNEWVAPNDRGGKCWFIDWANDPPGPGGKFGFGGCAPSSPPSSDIGWGSIWGYPHPDLLTVYGRVYAPAARVDVRLVDGSALTLPVVEDFFLGSLPNGAKVERNTAYDDSGNAVAESTRTR